MARMPRRGVRSALRRFLESEAAGGIILMGAAATALLVANIGLYEPYHDFFHRPLGAALGPRLGPTSLHFWINDGLMAIFFLLIGLEIKREFVDGELANPADRRLPILAAAAGMIVPAFIYLVVTRSSPGLASGWAIPAATDIAFAIGVLSLLGRRAPASLKLFLTSVAIADDMGAVAIIAIAYTSSIDILSLAVAAGLLALMYGLNVGRVRALSPYVLLALLLWYFTLRSGVHATVAGVLAAAAIPVCKTPGGPEIEDSPLHRLEHKLAGWVAFLVVPLFGFANAGVPVTGLRLADLLAPLPLGIALGLFAGKQLGIFAAILVCTKLRIAPRPRGATWLQTYAVTILCGIGFTMSLFIGAIAFPGREAMVDEAKLGVLAGSLMSALVGFAILRFAPASAGRRTSPHGRAY
jgi:NhaA family Na+:H+ antiporter